MQDPEPDRDAQPHEPHVRGGTDSDLDGTPSRWSASGPSGAASSDVAASGSTASETAGIDAAASEPGAPEAGPSDPAGFEVAESEVAAPEGATSDAQRPQLTGTGHPAVDAVLASLDGLDERPVHEHLQVFSDAHDALRRALDEAGEQQVPSGERHGAE